MTTISRQVPWSQSDPEPAKIYIKQSRVVERGQLALWNIETKPRAQQSPAVHASRNRLRSTVMTEWLTLLLLVPAVVVPVVLLVGFAGCDRVFGLEHIDTPPPVPVVPVIVSADGESGTVITLTWMYSGSAADFEFERMKLPERTRGTFTAATSPHHDDNNGQGLEPGTDYLYRVRAIGSDGEASEWSSPEPNILGTTDRDDPALQKRLASQIHASSVVRGQCFDSKHLYFKTTRSRTRNRFIRFRFFRSYTGQLCSDRAGKQLLNSSGHQVPTRLTASVAHSH